MEQDKQPKPKAREEFHGRQPQGEHKCTTCGAVFELDDDLRKHELEQHARL
jgi:hypothetical protein